MTLHYHGTPITPLSALYQLAGCCFCVSYAKPEQINHVLKIGQSIMLDNGAFSVWRRGVMSDWLGYYCWCQKVLSVPVHWAVIPDVIDGSEDQQDQLIVQWPHGDRGAPVWHMNESIDRLLRLIERWPRVCIGSTSVYARVLSDLWRRRMDQVWTAIVHVFSRIPWVHMLRGMACCDALWPFSSVDSTDVARNHHRSHNSAGKLVHRWDVVQCPSSWRLS